MRIFVFILFISASAINNDNIQGLIVVKDNFPAGQDDVEFGTGYNTVKLQRTNNSAVQVNKGLDLSGGYIEYTYKIELCKSREEFLTSFSDGISASASYMGVDGSASIKFLTEWKVTSLDSVLVAGVDVITDTETATQVQFSDTAQTMLDDEDYGMFVETYGTHYLRKIILGGKMVLIMKFSSRSQEEKEALDSKLGVSTGTFGAKAEFAAKMQGIRESSSLEVSLYVSGGDTEPPKPDVKACINYAIKFANSVLVHSTVREVEYAAVWTIPGISDSFKRYLFPLQGKTDKIVEMSISLLNIQFKLTDMLAQRGTDLAFFTPQAWDKVSELKDQTMFLRTKLQNDFKNSPVSDFPELIEDYHGTPKLISAQISEIFVQERMLDHDFVMRNSGSGKYLSTASNSYPRLNVRSPVSVQFEDTSGGKAVEFGGSNYAYVRSVRFPSKVLCMESNNWYVFWGTSHGDTKCQWRLVDATLTDKREVQYRDRILLHNRYWPNYLMGMSENRRWVACVDDTQAGSIENQWVLERSH